MLSKEAIIEVAETTIANVKRLLRHASIDEEMGLDKSIPFGIFGERMGDENRQFYGQQDRLFDMHTEKLVGHIVKEQQIQTAAHPVDDILKYLRHSGESQATEALQKACDEVQKDIAVIYSRRSCKRNALDRLVERLETVVGLVKTQKPTEEAVAFPAQPTKESWLWKLYEKTLKIAIEALINACKGS